MLGKLMKHEFRATGRIMLPLLGAELLLSVLAGFSVRGLDRIENMSFLGVTYILTLGKEGIREASGNAVLNANYLMANLKDYYNVPYGDQICMHEFVMSLQDLKNETGVSAMDIAKGSLDFGIHPPTMYFPLIVHEALMLEPTETESQESLDEVIDIFRKLHKLAHEDPEYLQHAPHNCMISRPDEVQAARNPILRYEFEQ